MFFFGLPFFVNDAATTEIYTLSLHDALPISPAPHTSRRAQHHPAPATRGGPGAQPRPSRPARSEEHTSELQSRPHLVCRLLLEKKNESAPGAHQHHHNGAGHQQDLSSPGDLA